MPTVSMNRGMHRRFMRCTKVYGWAAEVLSGTQFLFQRENRLSEELSWIGEELSVGFGDLTMLLGGVSKDSYASTYDITQAGAATGNQMVKILAEYLAQASDGSDSGVTVAEAAASLNARKRELQQEQRRADEEREVRLRELRLEKNLLEQECEGIRASIEKYEAHYADDESGMHAKYHEQTGSTEDWQPEKNWLYPILLRNPDRNNIIWFQGLHNAGPFLDR